MKKSIKEKLLQMFSRKESRHRSNENERRYAQQHRAYLEMIEESKVMANLRHEKAMLYMELEAEYRLTEHHSRMNAFARREDS